MYQQHQEKEKQEMIAIATSEEAQKVYEEGIKYENSLAFEENLISTYEVDAESLKYNPMGGLMVKVVFNSDPKLNASYNLIDNGDGTYHSAYFTYSPQLVNYLSEDDDE